MRMLNSITTWAFALVLFLVGQFALAQAAADVPVQDFAAQVLGAISSFGGLPWVGKIALIVTVVLSSIKVLPIRTLIWDKLGNAKAFAAPVLGLILGVLTLAQGGQLSFAGVMAYVSAGAGAIILHELVDALKAAPWVGAGIKGWLSILDGFFASKK